MARVSVRTGSFAIALVLFGAVASAQLPPRDAAGAPRPPATASIRGRVTAADTGRPLRRVSVTAIAGSPNGPAVSRSTQTDVDGRFVLSNVPAGRYEVRAERPGYLTSRYGQRHYFAPGTPIDVRVAQAIDGVTFELRRAGVIAGQIVDEIGDPFPGLRVSAMQVAFFDGRRRLVQASGWTAIETNDIGEYRIAGLEPGEYVVMARTTQSWASERGPTDRRITYPPTYHPGVDQPAMAQRVAVAPGQTVAGVDFAMTFGRVSRVSGMAFDADGRPLAGGMVGVASISRGPGFSASYGIAGASVKDDGSFTVDLTPGDYTLRATRRANTDTPAVVAIAVTGEDMTGVVLRPTRGVPVKGEIVVDEADAPPLASTGIEFRSPDTELAGNLSNIEVDDTGRFEVRAFAPGIVKVTRPPNGWDLESVRVGDRDITDQIVDLASLTPEDRLRIVLTRAAPANVAVHVRDERGEPAPSPDVVAFADDARFWVLDSRRLVHSRADPLGNVRIQRLPPGAYHFVALEYVVREEWRDPEVLEEWKAIATRATVVKGRSIDVDLMVRRRP